jgi:hypothetical protein
VASDPDEVHALLCASDRYQAERFRSPAPVRNPATTRSRVLAGAVHLLRDDGRAAAMFTFTDDAQFDEPDGVFPPAHSPRYLGRMAVRPDLASAGSLFGVHCVRHAVHLARQAGADAIRAEANPDLAATVDMLTLLGFQLYGVCRTDDAGRRRVWLQRSMT